MIISPTNMLPLPKKEMLYPPIPYIEPILAYFINRKKWQAFEGTSGTEKVTQHK